MQEWMRLQVGRSVILLYLEKDGRDLMSNADSNDMQVSTE